MHRLMQSRLVILCLVIFFVRFRYCQGAAKRNYYVFFDSVDFKILKPELVEGNVTLTKYDERRSVISSRVYFKTHATNYKMILNMYEMKNGKYRPFYIVNKIEDLCAYLRQPSFIYLTHFLYPEFLKNGNFPKSCPVKKGRYYYTNVTLNEAGFPPTVPLGNYKLTIGFVPMKQLICTLSIRMKFIGTK